MNHGYARGLQRQALLDEVARLRPLLPDTPAVKHNLKAIEDHTPVAKMDDTALRSFVDLLARSVPAQ